MYRILSMCPLFRGLQPAELEQLITSNTHQIKKFAKEEIVVQAGDKCDRLMIPLEGTVRGEMIDFSGKVVKIEDIGAPKPLATAFLFGGENQFPVTITANEPASLLIIQRDVYLQMMQQNRVVLLNYLNVISNRAQFLTEKLKFLSFQTIKGKIAHLLLQMAKEQNSMQLFMPHSQNELAEMFAVTRPALGRAIREMHNDGIIFAEGKNMAILDKRRLAELMK